MCQIWHNPLQRIKDELAKMTCWVIRSLLTTELNLLMNFFRILYRSIYLQKKVFRTVRNFLNYIVVNNIINNYIWLEIWRYLKYTITYFPDIFPNFISLTVPKKHLLC